MVLSCDLLDVNIVVMLVILNQLMLDSYEAVWIGEDVVMKVKTDIASKLWNKVGEKVGKSFGSTRLMRGYVEPALSSDTVPPIGHLVFVIHGIGQNMNVSDIVKSTSE